MLTNEQVEPLLNAVFDEKPQEFVTIFDELLRATVSQKVADRKTEIAQSLFVDPEEVETMDESEDPPKDPKDDEEEEELLPGEEDLEGDEDSEEETDGAEDVDVAGNDEDGDEEDKGEEVAEGKSGDSDTNRDKEKKFRKRDSARLLKKASKEEE